MSLAKAAGARRRNTLRTREKISILSYRFENKLWPIAPIAYSSEQNRFVLEEICESEATFTLIETSAMDLTLFVA